MAKINISQGQLLAWHNERNQLQGTLMEQLLSGRINNFYKDNSMRIKAVLGRRDVIYEEFFVFENGSVVMETVKIPLSAKPEAEKKLTLIGKFAWKKPEQSEQEFKEEQRPKMKDGKLFENAENALREFSKIMTVAEV